jgi:hypothetical protein
MGAVGTTSTSGWAVFTFLVGFTVLGTSAIGGGAISVVGGLAILGISCVLFKQAKIKEEA